MKKPRGHLLKVDDMKFIMGLPFFTFTATALARGMISPGLKWLVYLVAALCFTNAVFFIVLGMGHLGDNTDFGNFKDRRTRVTWKVTGFLCLSALAGGWLVGIVADEAYMDEYFRLKDGSVHKDVVPSGLGAPTFGDATVLEFAKGAVIDTERTVGYMEDGEVYCVAPLTGSTFANNPKYFAVGKDCCDQRSNFDCYKGPNEKDKVLKAIVRDTQNDDPYLTAIRVGESVYNMKLGSERIPLVFVEDTDEYIGDYWEKAFLLIMCLSIFQGLCCIVTGYVIRNLVRDPPRSSYF